MITVQSEFSKFFPSSLIREDGFSNSSGLKSVFEKLCFRDGLVWTVGLTKETKMVFEISPLSCGRGLNLYQL